MRWPILVLGALCTFCLQSIGYAGNSVVVESKAVAPGATGVQIGVYIDNDVPVAAIVLPLEIREVTSGSFITGTAVLTVQGRVAASGLMDLPVSRVLGVPEVSNTCSGPLSRTYSVNNPADFISPDAFFWAGNRLFSDCLPPGSDGLPGVGTPSWLFTVNVTSQVGTFEIDTCCVTPANHLGFAVCPAPAELLPSFTRGVIEIGGSSPKGTVLVESRSARAGETGVTLDISIGNDVQIEDLAIPLVARTISGGAFWTNVTSTLDTLPWHGRLADALFEQRVFDKSMADGVSPDPVLLTASKGAGPCLPTGSLESMITLEFDIGINAGEFEIDTAFYSPTGDLQFIECGSGLPSDFVFFKGVITVDSTDQDTFPTTPLPTGSESVVYSILREDFDGDENLDIALTGIVNLRQAVYFGDGGGGFTPPLYLAAQNLGSVTLTAGYINNDRFPDLIGISSSEIRVNLSNGDRTFTPAIVTPGFFGTLPGVAAGHVNGDAHLDLVVATESGGRVYFGDGTGAFVFAGTIASGSFHIVGLTDLNDDGHLDAILVGVEAHILLGDGTGSFSLSHVEPLSGSSFNIQVSTAGNLMDFNKDGRADFVLTQPRSGGEDSDLHIVFGDGLGGVAAHLVRPIGGTCYPVYVLDYNYDGNLDIAVGSSSKEKIYIIAGDGLGGFAHTTSLVTSPTGAVSLTAGDFREDGRWDFAVGDAGSNTAVFLNTAAPVPLFDSQMVSLALNDVRIRVTNPLGLSSSELGTAIAGARVALRDADTNSVLDQQISDLNLQMGSYDIALWRAPGAVNEQHYTFGIGINGHQARVFARNAEPPTPGDTFHFTFPIGGNLEVLPETGGFASSLQPTFDWGATAAAARWATQFAFELDDYWDFSSPEIIETTLTQPTYTPPAPLLGDTLYYWRVRSKLDGAWGPYSPTYAVNTLPCVCPFPGDFDETGSINAVDLTILINVIFFGSPDIQDVGCPNSRGDFDCNGVPNAVDLTLLIGHIFFGGADPCDGCI